MGDERLRRLEREAASGGVEARARLLRERVRQGALAEERLRLAALLDDPAARLALEGAEPPSEEDLRRWLDALVEWNEEVRARLALLADETPVRMAVRTDARAQDLLDQIAEAGRSFLRDGSRRPVDLRTGRPPVLRRVAPGPSREAVGWAVSVAHRVLGERLRDTVRRGLLPHVLDGRSPEAG